MSEQPHLGAPWLASGYDRGLIAGNVNSAKPPGRAGWSASCPFEFFAREVFEEGPQRGGLGRSDHVLQMFVVYGNPAFDPLEERVAALRIVNQDAPLVGRVRHPVDETVGNHSVRELGQRRMIHQDQFGQFAHRTSVSFAQRLQDAPLFHRQSVLLNDALQLRVKTAMGPRDQVGQIPVEVGLRHVVRFSFPSDGSRFGD